jgi:hypothetical protein
MLFEEEVLFPTWHPGGRCFGPRVVVMLQPRRSGRGGGEVLERSGPVALPCESFGTRMLRWAPREGRGRRRDHFVGSHCLVRAGRSRGGCLPAASRFRLSQWCGGAGTCARLSGEWVLCVAPTAASGGRLNSASSLGVPSPFPLRGAHCGPRCPARWAGPSPGPRVSPSARLESPAESAAVAGLGRGVAGAYVGALVRPAAGRQYPGD